MQFLAYRRFCYDFIIRNKWGSRFYSSSKQFPDKHDNTNPSDTTDEHIKVSSNNTAQPKSSFKSGSVLHGLTFISNKERLYSARKITCDSKSNSQAFFTLNEILKEAKIKETLDAKKRHIKKGVALRGKLQQMKKHMFDNLVFTTSRKIACIDDCIKED